MPSTSAMTKLGISPARSFTRSHRSEEHTSELQSPDHLVCRLLLEKKKNVLPIQFTATPGSHHVFRKKCRPSDCAPFKTGPTAYLVERTCMSHSQAQAPSILRIPAT